MCTTTEKVVGILLAQGLTLGCSSPGRPTWFSTTPADIRDKAEQKVFTAPRQFKREAGRTSGSPCWDASRRQEGLRIFEKAPHVSLVCGSAS